MALTNRLKKKLDLPVWEWLKPSQLANDTSGVTLVTSKIGTHDYLYHIGATTWRYNVVTDGWQQLTTAPTSVSGSLGDGRFENNRGYIGRVLSCPSNTSLQIAGIYGQLLKGYTIRIIRGTGAGQERVITDVADAVVHDTMICTGSGAGSITDSSKSFAVNQYRGYQIRVVHGSGQVSKQIFQIFSNSANTAYITSGYYQQVDPTLHKWRSWISTPSATAGSQTIAQIESHVITVDAPWDVNPDNTSVFMVKTGVVWWITGTTPYLQCYDLIMDAWYYCTTSTYGVISGLWSAVLASDYSLAMLDAVVGAEMSSTATSGTSNTLVDAGLSLTVNQYKNYRIRITAGTGIGQERTILSNDATSFTVLTPWATAPDVTTEYSVYIDFDKMYFFGGGTTMTMAYSVEMDILSHSKIYDYGHLGNMCVKWSGMQLPMHVSSITRSGTTATATTAIEHPLKAGDTVTIYGATDALYNITATVDTAPSATTFTYTMAGTPASNAVASNSQSTTLVVDPSKNWTVNEHVGRYVQYMSAGHNTQVPTWRFAKITANTATTLTIPTNTAPTTNGRYAICDPSAFGCMEYGAATSGSTTTIVDTTKNWTTNIFAGRRVRILAGAGAGQEAAITSNTNNTLTIGTITAADSTSLYAIMPIPARSTGINAMFVFNSTNTDINRKCIYIPVGGGSAQWHRYNVSTEAYEYVDFEPYMTTLTTGAQYAYDGDDRIYFTQDATTRLFYIDLTTHKVEVAPLTPYAHSTARIGNRMEIIETEDGLKFLYLMRHNGYELWRTLLWW